MASKAHSSAAAEQAAAPALALGGRFDGQQDQVGGPARPGVAHDHGHGALTAGEGQDDGRIGVLETG